MILRQQAPFGIPQQITKRVIRPIHHSTISAQTIQMQFSRTLMQYRGGYWSTKRRENAYWLQEQLGTIFKRMNSFGEVWWMLATFVTG